MGCLPFLQVRQWLAVSFEGKTGADYLFSSKDMSGRLFYSEDVTSSLAASFLGKAWADCIFTGKTWAGYLFSCEDRAGLFYMKKWLAAWPPLFKVRHGLAASFRAKTRAGRIFPSEDIAGLVFSREDMVGRLAASF